MLSAGLESLEQRRLLATVTLPTTLTDNQAFIWDVSQNGSITDGSNDAFDGGLALAGFANVPTATTEDADRELTLGPNVFPSGIEVTRKIFVPSDQAFARYLEVVSNPTSNAITHTVTISTNLGSDGSTVVVGTSSGDSVFTVADDWIVTDDADASGDPTIVHVLAGDGGVDPGTVSSPTGSVNYAFTLTLQPGETQSILHFAAQRPNRAAALATADALALLGLGAVDDLTDAERAAVVNFDLAPIGGTLSGTKWNDLDGDGARQTGEPGLPNWTIYLDLNEDGNLNPGEPSTLTDVDGNYIFTGLPAGDYVVAEVQQAGWSQTSPFPPPASLLAAKLINEVAGVDAITNSPNRKADLSTYTAEEIASATQWVVLADAPGVAPELVRSQLAKSIGGTVAPIDAVDGAFLWTPANADAGAKVARDGITAKLGLAVDIDAVYPLVVKQQTAKAIPNDTLFSDQWHLRNTGQNGGTTGSDVNITGAWDSVRGNGVVIGIVDDGLQFTHPDLAPNYNSAFSFDFNNNDSDPSPNLANDFHGTAVAGVAAGRGFNNLGVSGAAPNATLAGLRLISAGTSDLDEANALSFQSQNIDIYSNSWGPFDSPGSEGYTGPGPLTQQVLANGVANGRGGLGSIYVWAAGNGLQNGDNTNLDGYANSRYTIAVAAIDHNGQQSFYSEPGSPILVTTYSNGDVSGITTTDLVGSSGYQSGDYTDDFGGTSSATPLVSGIIALMLETNPNLTWRDVQHILVETAAQNDALDSDWLTNGAGYQVNHKYGFGSVDAGAAVAMAAAWTTVPTEVTVSSPTVPVNQSIPDNNSTGVTATTTIADDITIESVEIDVNVTHTYVGDLNFTLTSPSGTQSILSTTNGAGFDNLDWTYTSMRHWGESSAGTWTLKVADGAGVDVGTFNNFRLTFNGVDPGTTGGNSPVVTAGAGVWLVTGLGVTDVVEDLDFGNQALPSAPGPQAFSIGDWNSGIAASDNNTGAGYLMFSEENVFDRFATSPPFSAGSFQNSDHLIAVRFTGSSWQYDNNSAWVNFVPITNDRLLASVDFDVDAVTSLQGTATTIDGIEAGFFGGDLTFTANRFGGVANAGEFEVAGTHFTLSDVGPIETFGVAPVNAGVAAQDNNVGLGYVMYSFQNVFERFAAAAPFAAGSLRNSDHFIAVRLTGSQWQYDNNSGWIDFTPLITDHLVAAVDFDADTITSLRGPIGEVSGIASGFLAGDLAFTADRFANAANDGEFQVGGTFFTAPFDSGSLQTVSIGPINSGIATQDNNVGIGYLMYSPTNVFTRFAAAPPYAQGSFANSDQLIAVRLVGSQWQYDNNDAWVDFTPIAGDRLLASVDFAADTVTSLIGIDTNIGGIAAGFLSGDLTFQANRFGGVNNAGEFTILGTEFVF